MSELSFPQLILAWYAQNKRELPWRNISDPYKIWVSEIILQQTQIVQGHDYYLRFLSTFPLKVSLMLQKTKCCVCGKDLAITAEHAICTKPQNK